MSVYPTAGADKVGFLNHGNPGGHHQQLAWPFAIQRHRRRRSILFYGALDDFRVYRRALSQAEISALYALR